MTAGQSQHMLHQCSNSFSRNAEFVVTNFDMFRRRKVSQGVAKMFKSDPESMNELTEALQDPDFKELLAYAVAHPKSAEAKEMEKWLNPLMAEASTRLPFSPQSGSTAFAQMLANIRWYGNGGDFLTIAQQSWKSPIMYRYAVPCKTNSLGIHGENIG